MTQKDTDNLSIETSYVLVSIQFLFKNQILQVMKLFYHNNFFLSLLFTYVFDQISDYRNLQD
jgi:hypothetical protein